MWYQSLVCSLLGIKLLFSYNIMIENIICSSVPMSIFCRKTMIFRLLKWKCFLFLWFLDYYQWKIYYPKDTTMLNVAQKKDLKEKEQYDSQALFTLQQSMIDEIFSRIRKTILHLKKLGIYYRMSFKKIKRYMLSNYNL